jgi:hypothetical protein
MVSRPVMGHIGVYIRLRWQPRALVTANMGRTLLHLPLEPSKVAPVWKIALPCNTIWNHPAHAARLTAKRHDINKQQATNLISRLL